MVRQILNENSLVALIVSADHSKPGLEFFTPDHLSLQVGYMRHLAGHRIPPHVHYHSERVITHTMEALLVKSGRVRVDLFSDNKEFIQSETLQAGDLILLVSGGHGFEFLEDGEMLEIKQGPHIFPDKDREKF